MTFTVDKESLLPVLTLEGVTVVNITDVTLDEESSLSPVCTVTLKLHMQGHNGRHIWCHSGT